MKEVRLRVRHLTRSAPNIFLVSFWVGLTKYRARLFQVSLAGLFRFLVLGVTRVQACDVEFYLPVISILGTSSLVPQPSTCSLVPLRNYSAF